MLRFKLFGKTSFYGSKNEEGFLFTFNCDYLALNLNTNEFEFGNIENIKKFLKDINIEVDEKIQRKNKTLKKFGILVFKRDANDTFIIRKSFIEKKYLFFDFYLKKFLRTDNILDVAKYISNVLNIYIDFEGFEKMFKKLEEKYGYKNENYNGILACCLWKCSVKKAEEIAELFGFSPKTVLAWNRRYLRLP